MVLKLGWVQAGGLRKQVPQTRAGVIGSRQDGQCSLGSLGRLWKQASHKFLLLCARHNTHCLCMSVCVKFNRLFKILKRKFDN